MKLGAEIACGISADLCGFRQCGRFGKMEKQISHTAGHRKGIILRASADCLGAFPQNQDEQALQQILGIAPGLRIVNRQSFAEKLCQKFGLRKFGGGQSQKRGVFPAHQVTQQPRRNCVHGKADVDER